MKVEILKENLKSGVGIVERIVGRNLSLPVLSGFLIEAKDSFLNLISTDLEITIKVWILSKIIKEGRVVVPQKIISGLMSSLPEEKITMESIGQNLAIQCGGFKTQLQGYRAGDFPIMPQIKNTKCIEIDTVNFCNGVSLVVDIASSSIARPEISGVYFNFLKNNIRIAATDSFRLGEKSILMEKSFPEETSFILPQRTAKEVINIFENKEGKMKICSFENQVVFELPQKESRFPRAQIISRLIDGEYPNYQEIIPNKFETTAVLKKDEFLNQIKTSSLFASKINEVKVILDPEKSSMKVLAQNSDIGEIESEIPAKIKGKKASISFNYKFLIGGLLNIKSSEVIFNVSKEDGPCILGPVGDATYTYVVMPIKPI